MLLAHLQRANTSVVFTPDFIRGWNISGLQPFRKCFLLKGTSTSPPDECQGRGRPFRQLLLSTNYQIL